LLAMAAGLAALVLDHATVFAALSRFAAGRRRRAALAAGVGAAVVGGTYALSGGGLPFVGAGAAAALGAGLGLLVMALAERISPVDDDEILAGMALGLSGGQSMREIVAPAGRPGLLTLLNSRRRRYRRREGAAVLRVLDAHKTYGRPQAPAGVTSRAAAGGSGAGGRQRAGGRGRDGGGHGAQRLRQVHLAALHQPADDAGPRRRLDRRPLGPGHGRGRAAGTEAEDRLRVPAFSSDPAAERAGHRGPGAGHGRTAPPRGRGGRAAGSHTGASGARD